MATNSQAIVPAGQNKQLQTIFAYLEGAKKQIAQAVPKHLTAERMLRVVRTAISKTPKLQECSPISIVGAVIEASQLGLETDGILGQGYLVPFWNGKTRCMEAQFQPGYRGLIALARRSGQVSSISSELVYTADKFAVKFGVHRDLIHEPALDDPNREQSGIRGCYATVLYKDGTFDFEYMSLHELNNVRAMSKAKGQDGKEYGPWATHPLEMYRKVPVRRLAKRLPLSPEFQKAAMLDEYVDAGVAPSAALEVESAELIAQATATKAAELDAKYAPKQIEAESGEPQDPPQAPEEQPQAPAQETGLTKEEAEQAVRNMLPRQPRRRGRVSPLDEAAAPSQPISLTGIFQSEEREPGADDDKF